MLQGKCCAKNVKVPKNLIVVVALVLDSLDLEHQLMKRESILSEAKRSWWMASRAVLAI